MKGVFSILIAIILIGGSFVPAFASNASSITVPTFSIVDVDPDNIVTIKTYNFPTNDKFTVTMGAYGTKGIGGMVVGTTDSGSGGSFIATFGIPSALKGSYRIAIRLQSPTSGYYAYNWFYNDTTIDTIVPITGYVGYPYFFIDSVTRDKSVTINAYNFPADDKFTVRMGAYGTKGVSGIIVATIDTGPGGLFTATYDIPTELADAYRIAIRLESPTSAYYAYNWFYNNTTSGTFSSSPDAGYSGYPYFFITSVVKDKTVTINAHNFPTNDKFTVTMGAYGTKGISGIIIGTTETGSGSAFSATYDIPSELAGSYRIAIRLESPSSAYYAYNWFYNNTTP